MNRTKIEYRRISQLVIKYSHEIELSDYVYFIALDLAQELETNYQFFISGKSGSGLAAACIYIASVYGIGEIFLYPRKRMTLRDIERTGCGETCGVMASTIGHHCSLIQKELDINVNDWVTGRKGDDFLTTR